jgi:hypothetical protein
MTNFLRNQASRFILAAFALLMRALDSIRSNSSLVGIGFGYLYAPPFLTFGVLGVLATGVLILLNWAELNNWLLLSF